MKKSVFSEKAKARISEKVISGKRSLQGTFSGVCAKHLHQHPRYAVLYSLAFLYGVTSTAVFWRLAWEFGVRRMKEITLSRGTPAAQAASVAGYVTQNGSMIGNTYATQADSTVGAVSVTRAISMSVIVHVIGLLLLAMFCLALSVALLCMMKRISTAIWLWLFGEGEEKSDNRRYLPFAVGLCVSLLAAVGFQDISCVIGYYAAVDLCMLPLAMVAAWLLVRLDFTQ